MRSGPAWLHGRVGFGDRRRVQGCSLPGSPSIRELPRTTANKQHGPRERRGRGGRFVCPARTSGSLPIGGTHAGAVLLFHFHASGSRSVPFHPPRPRPRRRIITASPLQLPPLPLARSTRAWNAMIKSCVAAQACLSVSIQRCCFFLPFPSFMKQDPSGAFALASFVSFPPGCAGIFECFARFPGASLALIQSVLRWGRA